MKPIEYITDWIENNKDVIAFESILYEYHTFSETHFLKISPDSILTDEQFETILSEFILEFNTQFPSEGLCLIGNDSLTQLEQPLELVPQALPDIAPIYQESMIDFSSISDTLLPNASTINLYDFKAVYPSSWDLNFPFNIGSIDLNLPTVNPDTWNKDLNLTTLSTGEWSVKYDFQLDTPLEFSSVIIETKFQNSIEEPYSSGDEYQNQAA